MNSLFLWIKITKLLSAIDSVLSFFSLIIAQYLSIFQRSFFIDYKFITHYRCFNQFFIVISFFVVAGFSSESSLRCQLRRRSTHWRLWNPICPRLEPSRHGLLILKFSEVYFNAPNMKVCHHRDEELLFLNIFWLLLKGVIFWGN